MDEQARRKLFIALLSEFPVYDENIWPAVMIVEDFVIARILNIFLSDVSVHFADLRQLVNAQDYKGTWSILHSIKGSADNVGARRLARTAELLEHACRYQDYLGYSENFPELENQFNIFHQAVGSLIKKG